MASMRLLSLQMGRCCLLASGKRSPNQIIKAHRVVSARGPTFARSSTGLPFRSCSTAPDDDIPLEESLLSNDLIEKMSNEELIDTSTIPGWDLIHSPPRKFPRGALVGKVVSDKMQKTVNVEVVRYRIHPKVRKRTSYTRKFFAHDEKEVAQMGDTVMITPCHRISKHKHFMLREIIKQKGQLYTERVK